MKRVAAAAGAFSLFVAGAAFAGPDAVTLTMSQYRDVNGVGVLVFSGAISSGAAGETVELLGQDCGARGSRLLMGADTRQGGRWQLENPEHVAPYRSFSWTSGITFRARWKDELSDPVVLRLPGPIGASKVAGRSAWRVSVSSTALVKMAGKTVELQRQVSRRWVRFKTAKLKHKASFTLGPYNNEAVFAVKERGLRLRAYLPRASALPCFLPAASEPWRS